MFKKSDFDKEFWEAYGLGVAILVVGHVGGYYLLKFIIGF